MRDIVSISDNLKIFRILHIKSWVRILDTERLGNGLQSPNPCYCHHVPLSIMYIVSIQLNDDKGGRLGIWTPRLLGSKIDGLYATDELIRY